MWLRDKPQAGVGTISPDANDATLRRGPALQSYRRCHDVAVYGSVHLHQSANPYPAGDTNTYPTCCDADTYPTCDTGNTRGSFSAFSVRNPVRIRETTLKTASQRSLPPRRRQARLAPPDAQAAATLPHIQAGLSMGKVAKDEWIRYAIDALLAACRLT
jgi:hypothetical protein